MRPSRVVTFALWVGRIALAVTLLSAVADRFGLWGPPGSPRAAWGDWAHFVAYCGVLNSFAPKALIPALAWIDTGFEIVFGVGLLIGYKLEYVAYGSAGLFALFALAMTWSLGVKAPLDSWCLRMWAVRCWWGRWSRRRRVLGGQSLVRIQ